MGTWPVFNVADSAIVVGLIGLLWALMSTRDRSGPEPELTEEGLLFPMVSEDESVLDTELETTSVSENSVSEKREEPWE